MAVTVYPILFLLHFLISCYCCIPLKASELRDPVQCFCSIILYSLVVLVKRKNYNFFLDYLQSNNITQCKFHQSRLFLHSSREKKISVHAQLQTRLFQNLPNWGWFLGVGYWWWIYSLWSFAIYDMLTNLLLKVFCEEHIQSHVLGVYFAQAFCIWPN